MEPKIESQTLATIAWMTLFGEAFEEIPDPNKPENVAYHGAKKKEASEKLKRFFEGPGSILFERWQSRVRSGIFSVMTQNIPSCDCQLTREIKEMQYIFKLLAEAQMAMEE